MKSFLFKYIVVNVLTLALIYLMVSFVKADFNAFNWSEEIRGGMSYLWLCSLILSIPALKLIETR